MKHSLTAALVLASVITHPTVAQEPIWDANTVHLRPQHLGPGVYALVAAGADELAPKGVPLATTSGIVTGTRASLVIDTMINRRLAESVLKELRALTGGPPTYAVNTSYHGDHSYGNHVLPEGTRVIQHAATKAYIDKHFDDDVKFMLGAFGKGRGIEQARARAADILVPKDGHVQLDLGGRLVEIRDFGFAQTGGDLWVWLPQEQVLFAGNPVIAEKPAIPWLLDGHMQASLDTLLRVRAFLPDGATVVPGHGRPMPKAGLDWHIEYLTLLRERTRAAIARGATLAQAVAEVEVAEAQPYAIYAWVHKQINVPAAYRELTR
jgi:cyclase